jgi:hypothetical protein
VITKQLVMWFDRMNDRMKTDVGALTHDMLTIDAMGHFQARVWLQRIFSDAFTRIQAEDPVSEVSLKLLSRWRFAAKSTWPKLRTDAEGKGFLRKRIMINEVSITVNKNNN